MYTCTEKTKFPMWQASTTKGNLYSGSATGVIGLVGSVEMRNLEGI